MPEKICRLCLSIIDSNDCSGDSIYVLSKLITTEMPPCIEVSELSISSSLCYHNNEVCYGNDSFFL